ncbi:peptidoglycan-binding domain-containing protein [Streptomyces erythrochromogenes]|uniref:peptidoglycan-binding domain-containing protein n=1 Tax=Streptomyces erythrochromogenes TaxID=285574 RepID=UPI00331B7E33
MKFKRTLATLGSAAAMTAGLIGLGPAAHAAIPGCTSYAIYYSGSTNAWHTKVPTVGLQGTNFCTLRAGASGTQVYHLQDTLNYCYGQDVGGLDGVFGAKTTAALKRVQASLGLDADGVYGPQTRDKLKWHWSNMEGAHNTCNTLTGAGAH